MVYPVLCPVVKCEATNLKYSPQLAVSSGYERVNFESDCEIAVNVVNYKWWAYIL